MIALTVTAIIVVVLRALNVKTFFFGEQKRERDIKERERDPKRRRFKSTITIARSFFYFVTRLLGGKKIRKNCIERFSSSSSSSHFFSIV